MRNTRLFRKLRYRIDELFAREFVGQLFILTLLVAALTLLGTTAVFFGLFSPENAALTNLRSDTDPGLLQGLWWSLLQVLNLPGFRNAKDASGPILGYAFVLSLASLAVFALLISIIRTGIARRLEALSQGDTAVEESGHLLILGWSDEVIALLRQLSMLADRPTVVILTPRSVRSLQTALRLAGIVRKDLKLVLRTGQPSEPAELMRVAIDSAASVIIPSDDQSGSGRAADNQVLRILTLLAQRTSWRGKPPSVVAEIADVRNHELAEIASAQRLFLVKTSRVLGKLLVQSALRPGLSEVYRQLFDLSGQNLRVSFQRRYHDQTVGTLQQRLDGAILLGFVSPQDNGGWQSYKATLNPPDDHILTAPEGIVYLCEQPGPALLQTREILPSGKVRDSALVTVQSQSPCRVLIIGWNNEIHDVIREFAEQAMGGLSITLLSALPEDQARTQIQQFATRVLSDAELSYVQGTTDIRVTYAELDVAAFDFIVVLADQLNDDNDADAHTLRVLLQLSQQVVPEVTRRIVQLQDASSRVLMAGLKVDEVIVSRDVIGAQLSQIALHRSLGAVYPQLMSAGDVEIVQQPVSEYVQADQPSFRLAAGVARAHRQIALGFREQATGRLIINPGASGLDQMALTDQLLVLRASTPFSQPAHTGSSTLPGQ